MAAAREASQEEFIFIVIGKTGAGKSATGNTILSERAFESMMSTGSVTKICEAKSGIALGHKVTIVDCPGLADTEMDDKESLERLTVEIERVMNMFSAGFDAILVVIHLGRLTKEDKKAVMQLNRVLGDNFIEEYGILVVTHGDTYNPEEADNLPFGAWANKQGGTFKELRTQCCNRMILFDNRTTEGSKQEKQLKELFEIVRKRRQTPRRYKPESYHQAQPTRDHLLVEYHEPFIRERTDRDIKVILHELEKLDPKDTSFAKLADLKAQVKVSLNNLGEQDKGTGALEKVISKLEDLMKTIEVRISEVENSVRVEREVQAKKDDITQAVGGDAMQRMMQMIAELKVDMEEERTRRIEKLEERLQSQKCVVQ